MRPQYSKKAFYISVLLFILTGCEKKQHIRGEAFGTTYSIFFFHENSSMFRTKIDSIIEIVNSNFSTYQKSSTISRWNTGETTIALDKHFIHIFQKADSIWKLTNGAFDPTVGVLTNAWGFGSGETLHDLDSIKIDSLLDFVGMEKLQLQSDRLISSVKGMSLDFNAFAKGYALDLVADMFGKHGVTDFLIEIGGEVIAKGNNKGKGWKIGIDTPLDGIRHDFFSILELTDKAMATSGNYRKYYWKHGKKIVHTIYPKTGYPQQNMLKGVSVIADDCLTADAFATAFMVIGLQKSKEILETHTPKLDALLIWENEKKELKSFATEYFEKHMR